MIHNCFFIYGAQAAAAQFAATFKEFPPLQKPNTFTIDDALKAMESVMPGASCRVLESWNDGAAKSAITGFAARDAVRGTSGTRRRRVFPRR